MLDGWLIRVDDLIRAPLECIVQFMTIKHLCCCLILKPPWIPDITLRRLIDYSLQKRISPAYDTYAMISWKSRNRYAIYDFLIVVIVNKTSTFNSNVLYPNDLIFFMTNKVTNYSNFPWSMSWMLSFSIRLFQETSAKPILRLIHVCKDTQTAYLCFVILKWSCVSTTKFSVISCIS